MAEHDLTAAYCVIILSAIFLFGAFYCLKYWVLDYPRISIRSIVIGNCLVSLPLSGIVHILHLSENRGFFDLVNYGWDAVVVATVATVIAVIALIFGMAGHVPNAPVPSDKMRFDRADTMIVLALLVVVAPLGLFGLMQVSKIVLSTADVRIISLTDGNARYSYLAQWLDPLLILVFALFMANSTAKSPWLVASSLVIGSAMMASTLSWSGGRSELIVYALPLFAFAFPRLAALRLPTVVFGLVATASYTTYLSLVRAMRFNANASVNPFDWLDWQWGRFSMIGTSIEFTRMYGSLHGETFFAAIVFFLSPALRFLGIEPPVLWSSTDVSSRVIFGNFEKIYAVPGFLTELHVNFGALGVAVGFYILGRASRFVDFRISTSERPISLLLWYYLGSLLVFRVIGADSASIAFYAVYTGAPLVFAAVVSWMTHSRKTHVPATLQIVR